MSVDEFKDFLIKNNIKLDFDWPIDLHEIGCTYTLDERKLLYDDVLIDPHVHMSNSKDAMDHYLHAIKAQGKIDEIHEDLVTILHGDLPDLDDYKICEVESSNGSNDSGMSIDEFKEFLEKNHVIIKFEFIHDGLNIKGLKGKFYHYEKPLFVNYITKIDICNIGSVSKQKFTDILIQALAKDSKIDEMYNELVSKLSKDDGEKMKFCEIELPDGLKDSETSIDDTQKEIEGRLEEAEITNGKETSIREETLDAAKRCVMGDREQDYGTPESNFATIASFWSDYLDMDISAQQVADMMILMKISRIKNGGGTGDSYVDIAGYAACGNEILNKAHK